MQRRTFWSLFGANAERWIIAYRPATEQLQGCIPDMTGFTPIYPPAACFYADPFAFRWEDVDYIFFETYVRVRAKGIISYAIISQDGTLSAPRKALEREYHLSHPFLFEHKGEIYMIPETAQTGALQLFRAESIPDRWVFVANLLEGLCAVDATLFEHEGRWFMFAGVGQHGGSNSENLFLFVADEPLGPWRGHPGNPIVSDISCSRPAGSIFVRDGQLIRPAQDCSLTYGHSIKFQQIDVLSETAYSEHNIGKVEPDWMQGIMCTHTYQSNGWFEVADARRA